MFYFTSFGRKDANSPYTDICYWPEGSHQLSALGRSHHPIGKIRTRRRTNERNRHTSQIQRPSTETVGRRDYDIDETISRGRREGYHRLSKRNVCIQRHYWMCTESLDGTTETDRTKEVLRDSFWKNVKARTQLGRFDVQKCGLLLKEKKGIECMRIQAIKVEIRVCTKCWSVTKRKTRISKGETKNIQMKSEQELEQKNLQRLGSKK